MSLEDAIKADHVFCGYCGTRLRERLEPSPRYDRRTGKQGQVGILYWGCPNYANHDWTYLQYEENPHDSKFLRVVTA